MDDLNGIVNDIAEALHADKHGYHATPGPGYYKRYMTFHSLKNWSVEWNLPYLDRYGRTSLWLTTTITKPRQDRLMRIAAHLPGSHHVWDNQLLIPLPPRPACPGQKRSAMSLPR